VLTLCLPCLAEWELAAREDGRAGSLGGHARGWVMPFHRRDGQRAEESAGADAHGEQDPEVGRHHQHHGPDQVPGEQRVRDLASMLTPSCVRTVGLGGRVA
jgi:hypothetical protein